MSLLLLLYLYRVFRAQADWTFILLSELPTKQAAPLAEKNAATGLSDFSVRGASTSHDPMGLRGLLQGYL
jgi:hypothetical protein